MSAPRPPHSIVRLAIVSVVTLATTVVGGASALAAPLCSLDSTARSLTVTAPASTDVVIAASSPYLSVNNVSCALLGDVNSVVIDMTSAPSNDVSFVLRTGPLGPGYTDEGNGSSEIEFSIAGMTTGSELLLLASDDGDGFRAGQFLNKLTGVTTGQVNLNARADGASPDVDVSFTSFPGQIRMYGGNGNDVLSGAGAGVAFTSPFGRKVYLEDGSGTDQVTGGSGDDFIVAKAAPGDAGNTFAGGAGSDTFLMAVAQQYASNRAAIRLDGLANDGFGCPGTGCAGDNVAGDFEIISGGLSNDYIVGDVDAEVLVGGGGLDTIKGLGGNDTIGRKDPNSASAPSTLVGGPGDDLLYPAAADTLFGGGGFDTVSFTGLPAGVTVSLDGLPNDGTPGMDADVSDDVERVVGSGFGDTITGNVADNVLLGGPGPDALFGLGGNDTLQGQGGNDTVDGGPGTDTCLQGAGTGTLSNCEA